MSGLFKKLMITFKIYLIFEENKLDISDCRGQSFDKTSGMSGMLMDNLKTNLSLLFLLLK